MRKKPVNVQVNKKASPWCKFRGVAVWSSSTDSQHPGRSCCLCLDAAQALARGEEGGGWSLP